NSKSARRGCPRVDPTGGLRQARLVADVVGILQLPEDLPTLCAGGCIPTCSQRGLHLNQASPNLPVQPFSARCGWPTRITGSDTASGGSCCQSLRRGFG